jgi:small-conductance mechanosensitive channel
MPDPTVIGVAALAVALAAGFVWYAPDLANQAYTTASVLVRVVILIAGVAALATGQLVTGAIIVFGVALYFGTQRPDEEVL